MHKLADFYRPCYLVYCIRTVLRGGKLVLGSLLLWLARKCSEMLIPVRSIDFSEADMKIRHGGTCSDECGTTELALMSVINTIQTHHTEYEQVSLGHFLSCSIEHFGQGCSIAGISQITLAAVYVRSVFLVHLCWQ